MKAPPTLEAPSFLLAPRVPGHLGRVAPILLVSQAPLQTHSAYTVHLMVVPQEHAPSNSPLP